MTGVCHRSAVCMVADILYVLDYNHAYSVARHTSFLRPKGLGRLESIYFLKRQSNIKPNAAVRSKNMEACLKLHWNPKRIIIKEIR